jgi:hypothetical protein
MGLSGTNIQNQYAQQSRLVQVLLTLFRQGLYLFCFSCFTPFGVGMMLLFLPNVNVTGGSLSYLYVIGIKDLPYCKVCSMQFANY